MNKLTVGSLFSGIGGIDLGLERTNGFEVKWQVEIDEYCTKVLAKHWPNVTGFQDIRDCGKHNLPPIDVLTGGFPCQPHSVAGKRKASTDERDLWDEFYRIICELKPRYAVGENVLGLLSSESGHFFGRILRDLAQIGYDAEWQVLSAAQFGAPHLRKRVFLVAYSQSNDTRRLSLRTNETYTRSSINGQSGSGLADTNSQGLPIWHRSATQRGARAATHRHSTRHAQSSMGRDATRLSSQLDGYHRWPAQPGEPQHDYEPPRTVTEKVPHRVARLKALGNAVVPQIATYIGMCILERESYIHEQ